MANNIFDKVLENIDIVQVVSQYVKLEPKGKNLFGLCPFHDDHSPSMSVSKEKGIFYCFVCKEAGNAIHFVEKYKHLSYIDATRELARDYHIDISEFDNQKQLSTQKYYDMCEDAKTLFSILMSNKEYSKDALSYLAQRGISEQTIQDFQIGLSPKDPIGLRKSLSEKGYLDSDMIINGLSGEKSDTFIDRIIVPIRNESGKVVAFGGRIYRADQTSSKYQNSKETPIFKKGQILFNLDKAISFAKKEDFLIINEGYMDVISAYEAGVKNSIALMGTAITTDQAQLIAKYAKNVCICLDSDDAGINAVPSIIKALSKENIAVSICVLEGAKDPDEFIRKFGRDKYIDSVKNKSMDKISFYYFLLKREYKEINQFNLDSFKKKIYDSIKKENNPILVETFLKKLSVDSHISYESIKEDYEIYIGGAKPTVEPQEKSDDVFTFSVSSACQKAEKEIISYAIRSYDYFKAIVEAYGGPCGSTNKEYRNIMMNIASIYDANPNIKSSQLLEELNKTGCMKTYSYDSKLKFEYKDLQRLLSMSTKQALSDELKSLQEQLKSVDRADALKLLSRVNEILAKLKK